MATPRSETTTTTPVKDKAKKKTPRSADSVAIDRVRSALEGLPLRDKLRVLGYVTDPLREQAHEELRAQMNREPGLHRLSAADARETHVAAYETAATQNRAARSMMENAGGGPKIAEGQHQG